MAEMALAGIEVTIRSKTRPRECPHEAALAILAAGVERSICETCGHISVSFVARVSGPVSRDHFARPADEGLCEDLIIDDHSPFADQERIGVRRRENASPEGLLLTA